MVETYSCEVIVMVRRYVQTCYVVMLLWSVLLCTQMLFQYVLYTIHVHIVYDMKYNSKHKARCVAGEHLIDILIEPVYSGL